MPHVIPFPKPSSCSPSLSRRCPRQWRKVGDWIFDTFACMQQAQLEINARYAEECMGKAVFLELCLLCILFFHPPTTVHGRYFSHPAGMAPLGSGMGGEMHGKPCFCLFVLFCFFQLCLLCPCDTPLPVLAGACSSSQRSLGLGRWSRLSSRARRLGVLHFFSERPRGPFWPVSFEA